LKYILGIDQGGTKTAAAVIDLEGNILGYGLAEGAYYPEDGTESAIGVIAELVDRILGIAAVDRSDIGTTVAGITGIDWPGDSELIVSELEQKLGIVNVSAYNDSVIAFNAGSLERFGAVICAGTGINAAVFCSDGSKYVMGDYLGSELQGASAISYRASRKVFDADIGALPPTALTELVLKRVGVNTPFELLKESIVNEDGFRGLVIGLTPKIKAAASAGDAVAIGLMDEFAQELCMRFVPVMRKTGMITARCDVVLAGSVFKDRHNVLRDNITGLLSEALPKARIVNAKYEPVVGACVMGFLQQAEFTEGISANLDASARIFGLIRTDEPEGAEAGIQA